MSAFARIAVEAPRQLLWPSLALIGLLLLLAAFLSWMDRWRKRGPRERLGARDQLAHFRSLYERGEISPEEYARIHALLSGRIRQEMEEELPPPPESPVPPTGAPTSRPRSTPSQPSPGAAGGQSGGGAVEDRFRAALPPGPPPAPENRARGDGAAGTEGNGSPTSP